MDVIEKKKKKLKVSAPPVVMDDQQMSLLASIVRSSDDTIIGKTPDGVITSWNPAAAAMYGYTEEEVVGKPISILLPPDRPREMDEILARIRRGERVEHYETVRKHKDGRLINVSLTVSPIYDASGRLIGASSIKRDITERKQAEERLLVTSQYARSLIEASLDPPGHHQPGRQDHRRQRGHDQGHRHPPGRADRDRLLELLHGAG